MSSLARKSLPGQEATISILNCTVLNAETVDITNVEAETITANIALVSNGTTNLNGTLDVTGEANITNDINAVNVGASGNIISDTYVVAQSGSNTLNSLQFRFEDSRQHIWSSGATPGQDQLNITGLDGNSDIGYKLIFLAIANATNTNNALRITFNNNITSQYFERCVRDGNGLYDNHNETHARIINPNTASDTTVMTGEINIYTEQLMESDNMIIFSGQYGSKKIGINNSGVFQVAGGLDQLLTHPVTNVTTITIDVTNGNHQGWDLTYRLYKIK